MPAPACHGCAGPVHGDDGQDTLPVVPQEPQESCGEAAGAAGKKLLMAFSVFTAHLMLSPRNFCDRSHNAAVCADSSLLKLTNAVWFTSGFTEHKLSSSEQSAKSPRNSSSITPSGKSCKINVFLLFFIAGLINMLSTSTSKWSDCCAAASNVSMFAEAGPNFVMLWCAARMQIGMYICASMCCCINASSAKLDFEKRSSKHFRASSNFSGAALPPLSCAASSPASFLWSSAPIVVMHVPTKRFKRLVF
mmetsp:Transcript_2874/g.8130  ORF Transcript_2874/g.8130 Transcript_2874/m.8130 type:complete len:249 (+) Transcript_2874:650-1396(+)